MTNDDRTAPQRISLENLLFPRAGKPADAEAARDASLKPGRLRVRVYDPEVRFISLANARTGRTMNRGPAG